MDGAPGWGSVHAAWHVCSWCTASVRCRPAGPEELLPLSRLPGAATADKWKNYRMYRWGEPPAPLHRKCTQSQAVQPDCACLPVVLSCSLSHLTVVLTGATPACHPALPCPALSPQLHPARAAPSAAHAAWPGPGQREEGGEGGREGGDWRSVGRSCWLTLLTRTHKTDLGCQGMSSWTGIDGAIQQGVVLWLKRCAQPPFPSRCRRPSAVTGEPATRATAIIACMWHRRKGCGKGLGGLQLCSPRARCCVKFPLLWLPCAAAWAATAR